jgi:PadR family transcriptional regulator
MAKNHAELVQGTLEMLVLRTLLLEPMHGWGITQRIQQMSEEELKVNQGSLYPALERLKRRGLIRDEWRLTENKRRARFYALTEDGRRQFEQEKDGWKRATNAVNRVLDFSGELS